MHEMNIGHETALDMQGCIEECLDCHRVCSATLLHCLHMGGKHVEPEHIALMLDCAQICQTSADFMLRSSAFHARTCALCAEVCDRCADDCERIDSHDTPMNLCADSCRRCAESCRHMASMAA